MTAYLAGVQERLRQAELSRVEAQAKAEEEAKRRVLAERLAEEARGRAEEVTRRAALERQRRKLQVGLAASLLALTTAAGLGTTYYLEQRQARAAAVEQVLGRASTLRELAREHAGDPARWQVALAAIDQAERALGEEGLARGRLRRSAPRLRPGPTLPHATGGLWTAWSTSAVPRPTTGEAGAPTRPTPKRSARPGWTWPHCPRQRPPAGSKAARPRWRPPWQSPWTTGPPSGAIGKKNGAGAAVLSALACAVDPDSWRLGLRRALDLPDPAARLEALR